MYLHPPDNAAVFCVDEKTAIQALDRSQPALPLRPGQPERQAVEYVRHGTVSLFAALEVHSGKVVGRCAARHTSQEFVQFLEQAVAPHRRKTIHVILDHLSANKTPSVRAWAQQHPNVQALMRVGLITSSLTRRRCEKKTSEIWLLPFRQRQRYLSRMI